MLPATIAMENGFLPRTVSCKQRFWLVNGAYGVTVLSTIASWLISPISGTTFDVHSHLQQFFQLPSDFRSPIIDACRRIENKSWNQSETSVNRSTDQLKSYHQSTNSYIRRGIHRMTTDAVCWCADVPSVKLQLEWVNVYAETGAWFIPFCLQLFSPVDQNCTFWW